LSAEFGNMPPSFLPVGNRRLYEFQAERIAAPLYMTVPETYAVPDQDAARLAALAITLLPVPENLSLGESVIFALNLIGGPDQPLRILHGDTLIEDLDLTALDSLATAPAGAGYSWAEVTLDGSTITGMATVPAGGGSEPAKPVAAGYFAFSHSTALIRAITRARGSFVAGLLDYAAETHPLQAAPVERWYDFGHVQTFFRSRRLVTSARHFNTLRIDGRTARKTSTDSAKITAEAAWYRNVPAPLRIFCARLVDDGVDAETGAAFYETEYDHLPTLAELFVFGTLGAPAWSRIFASCADFLALTSSATGDAPADAALRQLAVVKTSARLEKFAADSGFDIHAVLRLDNQPLPSLVQIAQDIVQHIDLATGRPTQIMHGDFCFSNILYDSRVQRIHVIDPRGYVFDASKPSIYGDARYDLAKFAHSVVGRYDQIVAGRYALTGEPKNFSISFEQAPHHAWAERALAEIFPAAASREIRALTCGLFLSMLPLHADRPDRQRAFIANALRLFLSLQSAPA
jgi:hypothetical protein